MTAAVEAAWQPWMSLWLAAIQARSGEAQEPTVEVIQRVVYRDPARALAAWRELGAEGQLAKLGLVVPTERERRTPEYRRGLQVTDRVRGLVLGDTTLAAEVARVARLAPAAIALDQVVMPEGLVARARAHVRAAEAFVIAVGPTGVGRSSLLRAVLAEAGRDVIEVDGAALAKHAEELRAQLQALAREARLLDRALLVRELDALLSGAGAEDRVAIVEQVLGRPGGRCSRRHGGDLRTLAATERWWRSSWGHSLPHSARCSGPARSQASRTRTRGAWRRSTHSLLR
jgi:hypothetical protein